MTQKNQTVTENKCPDCGYLPSTDINSILTHFKVCPNCGHHFRLNYSESLLLFTDDDSFQEIDPDIVAQDFLDFNDIKPYAERISAACEKTGLKDAMICGETKIAGNKAVVCIMDFSFMGGSMGSVVGEKLTRAAEYAIQKNLPLITFSSSGGARMQEGIISLMQMAKTSAILKMFSEKNLFFISVLMDPTTGGTTASFAILGDINISEPGALIGFAGRRVIEQTIKETLPPGFQTAEYLLQHGMLDMVVHRKDLKNTLALLLEYGK
ncbi:MAG: acetyl-CoA carboxylase, carboxyltransferase subunit beta [Candidatus Margulisbacteria bacterium]|nr:acetyl-CoA carboxylase, carboxyltransferase subunit beta [Candidatus Margulisiibacteriota bacterium]